MGNRFGFLCAAALLGASLLTGAEAFEKLDGVRYAQVAGEELLLDLYLPRAAAAPPLIVWVHGGAWRGGSRTSMPLDGLLEEGFAVASVDYRLTPVARFPAQIHDIKAAIRFLRANERRYGFDASRIAVAGASAGGHLAALVGVTNAHPELEGRVGDALDRSSDVQAIVSFYGAGNLTTILQQSTPHGLGVRIPALQLLLGSQPDDDPEVAKQASPLFHIDGADPPMLLLHGDQDPQMPINQSHELYGKYRELGVPAVMQVVHGAGHGGREFYDKTQTNLVADFLRRHMQSANETQRRE